MEVLHPQMTELDGYTIPVFSVNECPDDEFSWQKASKRLNCSSDSSLKYRYHCVSNTQRTSLVEFCYDATRPLVQKGNCMELAQSTTLNQYACNQSFRFGCPQTYYYSDVSFKYPFCTLIETSKKCYIAESGCLVQ
ncbi:uncharacterized protein LOC134266133 [Saccostrea cucullata]|uniref:uncharacterized protein LOC134266133 n=1 Tax=Saccostrea cuccullata TaxID=36930 RepID=UPI002ED13483